MNEYDDIINLPHHVSSKHPQMSMMNRAAQFAPFAALTGHSAAISETARLTESQQELADEYSEILNQKMAYLWEVINEHPTISITYFEPDKRKPGGKYVSIEGQLQNIDDYNQTIVLKNGEAIPLKSILDIQF
jgi:hypothetical protein